ncbi:MAG: TetR family transcriptional regulator [Myxococcota bacterium]
MSPTRRARRPEQKEARRKSILRAAAKLFDKTDVVDLPMSRVAKTARLAKGTLYIYFPTKEALFLALLSDELDAWFASLDEALPQGGTPETVAAALVSSISGRQRLLRLLTLMNGVLEHNIDEDTAAAFKIEVATHLISTGPRMEQALTGLKPGQGARLLLWLNAIVVGLYPLANPAPAVQAALNRPDLAPLRLDFIEEGTALIIPLLRGLTLDS